MARKPISLLVHKNTVAQRKKKVLRKDMIDAAKNLASARDLKGYAIVVFGEEGGCATAWQVPDGEQLMLPENTRMALSGEVHRGEFSFDD